MMHKIAVAEDEEWEFNGALPLAGALLEMDHLFYMDSDDDLECSEYYYDRVKDATQRLDLRNYLYDICFRPNTLEVIGVCVVQKCTGFKIVFVKG